MQKALTLVQTGIGKKALVAITGAILFGFVIVHMIGNLQVFLGPEHLDDYADFLHSMPKLLWAARIVLIVSVVTHIALTIQLATQNRAARGSRYRVNADVAKQSPIEKYARKTMVLSGLIVLAFVVFHIAHLTLHYDVVPGRQWDETSLYANVIHGFRDPFVSGFYVFANLLLGIHLFHGSHSLLQSIGARSPRFDVRIRNGAIAFATIVSLANVAMPLAILARLVGADLE